MNVTVRQAFLGLLCLVALLGGCESPRQPVYPALPATARELAATPRLNESLPIPSTAAPAILYGAQPREQPRAARTGTGAFTLDFADADIREVVAQILGGLLHASYTIDPAVHGSVTLHAAEPVPARQLLPALQMLLANAGAVLASSDGLYRIVPAASAGAAGSAVVPLRYVSADELAKVLQPVAGTNAKVVAEPGTNALLVTADPQQIQAVRDLVESFDTDALSNQSYALLPVTSGSAHDFAEAMQGAFRGRSGASLSGVVRVVPLPRLNVVLIVSPQPRYIDAARQIYSLVERERRRTVRGWHVYYLQNSNANDIAYTLQSAFTPNNITVQPDNPHGGSGSSHTGFTSGAGGTRPGGIGGGSASGIGAGAGGGAGAGTFGSGTIGGNNPTAPAGASATGQPASEPPAGASASPLLGGLDQSAGDQNADTMRILPNPQNNAILILGTPEEEETVLGMLRKIDIVPMQVRIDATIAEVTLNDNLQYGTQFFFKSGGINGILNNAAATVTTPAATVLGTSFPGFLLGGSGNGGAPIAISALQAVTTVNVLSSPQLTVVDNQTARLQVGALVPYLTASSQSTIAANAPVINSIAYQPTGVILEITPRVNSGGQITLDVSQEVSDVDTATTTSGIASPTFDERSVTSRVVVQDGQTVGMAGLIRDTVSRGNQGIPWLKDVPVLGALAGTQNNTRTRTELLVLITPHIIHSQTDMRALTEDMREGLGHAAAVPYELKTLPPSGSPDPNRLLRERAQGALVR
jgi:general secretion pathway protein D